MSEASRLSATAVVAGSVGKKLGLAAAPVKVASGGTTAAPGTVTLKLKFTAKARKRLKKAKSAKLTLQVVAVDGAGNQTRAATKTVTIKR